MKIIQLIQRPQLRGAEIAAMRSSVELEKRGCEVVVVSLFKGNASLDFPVRQVHLDVDFKNRFWSVAAWLKLGQLIRSEGADIVQANAGFTLKFAVFSSLVSGWTTPIVFRNASTISRYIRNSWSRWFNGIFFRKASHILSVSENSAKDFRQLYPHLSAKITVVPVGIDPFDILDRKRHGSSPVVLHIGGFTFEKNHSGLLRIFKRAVKEVQGLKLMLAGDGPLKKETELIASELGIRSQVEFLGNCSHVDQLFQKADVFVLPSIIEGLPSVILESFYAKVPVIAYNVGGVSEIVHNGVTGILVNENDEEGFISALLHVLKDPESVSPLVDKAHSLASDHYMNSQLVESTIAVYRSIVLPGRVAVSHPIN